MVTATIVILITLFVASGISTPLITELIRANGGYFKYSMLIALPLCIGQSCAILTNWKSRFTGIIRWRYIILISLMDMISYALNIHGLIYAGSVTYTIVHTSLTVYTAAFSMIFFDIELSRIQLIGVSVTIFGLILAIINAESDGAEVLFGTILILIGTLIHSLTYIATEYVLIKVDDAISPELLCSISGFIPALFYATWQVVYTIPNYEQVIVHSIESAHGNVDIVILCYTLLGLAAFVHSTLFYFLIHSLGSTMTSSSKIIQALIIFVASHYAFCPARKSQCLTTSKAVSFAATLLGIAMYSFTHDFESVRGYSRLKDGTGTTTTTRNEVIVISETNNSNNTLSRQRLEYNQIGEV